MLTKLIPDNTEGFLRASRLYYAMGEVEDSLKWGILFTVNDLPDYCREIRECLKLDPDHKSCYSFYKVSEHIVTYF